VGGKKDLRSKTGKQKVGPVMKPTRKLRKERGTEWDKPERRVSSGSSSRKMLLPKTVPVGRKKTPRHPRKPEKTQVIRRKRNTSSKRDKKRGMLRPKVSGRA